MGAALLAAVMLAIVPSWGTSDIGAISFYQDIGDGFAQCRTEISASILDRTECWVEPPSVASLIPSVPEIPVVPTPPLVVSIPIDAGPAHCDIAVAPFGPADAGQGAAAGIRSIIVHETSTAPGLLGSPSLPAAAAKAVGVVNGAVTLTTSSASLVLASLATDCS